ncbi:MAG: hypothetical protein K9H49_02400 [Bacteroidales bacterium]|nr:hypothetical protein [Bacteroidales bacterium]MCF8403420.1 hypothetical protein [Bacteroidales bacterium]
MTKLNLNPRIIAIAGVIIFGALMRLIPHWPNFTPIAAMALFGGAYLKKKHLAFIIPFAALLLSDVFLGFHRWMIAVYISFGLVVMIGMYLRNRVKVGSVLLATLASSLLFFVITNFAMWIGSPFYPQNFAGLIECYTLAVPFLNNGILGDLLFSTVFFGGFYLAQLRFPVLAKVKA